MNNIRRGVEIVACTAAMVVLVGVGSVFWAGFHLVPKDWLIDA